MADLSIFKLDSQTITIKDTTAREAAESAKTLATTASGNATTALNKVTELESEKADKTTATSSADGLMSKSDKAKLDGIGDSTIIYLAGSIFNEKTGPGIATGAATVVLNCGMALIFFDAQITTLPSVTAGVFTFGINIDHLRSMNPSIPAINPQNGGVINYTSSDGTVREDLRGYGGCFQGSNNNPAFADFLPARIFTTDGGVGGWATKDLQGTIRMSGVAIGTY